TVGGDAFANLDAAATYSLNERNNFSLRYHTTNRIPDHIFNLHQSSLVSYNWSNDYKNEKINTIEVNANTQFANASLQIRTLNDYLYFTDVATEPHQQIITPMQYGETIGYLSLKVSREFKFRKFALDNTLLYQ